MITQQLLEHSVAGIKAVSVRHFNGVKAIGRDECLILELDKESGGVWYKLDLAKSVIPIFSTMIYIAPEGIIQIAFNQ